jgi:transcriptional regulator with XRE-family HTH domain
MNRSDRAALAANLFEARDRRGWSQYELAARSGIHQPDISDIERCDPSINPTMRKLKALAAALQIKVTDLLKADGR